MKERRPGSNEKKHVSLWENVIWLETNMTAVELICFKYKTVIKIINIKMSVLNIKLIIMTIMIFIIDYILL